MCTDFKWLFILFCLLWGCAMGYLVLAHFRRWRKLAWWEETCVVERNLHCLNVAEEAGKTKTSLGCEKHPRDSTGFPLLRLSKPSTVLVSSASKEEEGILFAAFVMKEAHPALASTVFALCKMHPYSRRGRINLLHLLALGESSCDPSCRQREGNRFKYISASFRIEFQSPHHNTLLLLPTCFLHQILTWFLHCCAVAMWFW